MKKQAVIFFVIILLFTGNAFGDWATKSVPGVLTNREVLKQREKKESWWKKLGLPGKKTKDWHDSRGLGFYLVHNKGIVPVFVKTDIHTGVKIYPGKKEKLYRDDFGLFATARLEHSTPGKVKKIKRRYTARLKDKEKENHYVSITTPYSSETGTRKRVLKIKSKP